MYHCDDTPFFAESEFACEFASGLGPHRKKTDCKACWEEFKQKKSQFYKIDCFTFSRALIRILNLMGLLYFFYEGEIPRPIERRLDWVFYKTETKIWAVGCGLGWTVLKKVWADYEQLLREVFSTFCGQKKIKFFFWKHCSVCTKKLHRKKVKKNYFFLGRIFFFRKTSFF